jgi:hypothetical protein
MGADFVGFTARIETRHPQRAARSGKKAQDGKQRCGFAGTIAAEKGIDLTSRQRERQAVDYAAITARHDQIIDPDLVRAGEAVLTQTQETLVGMTNGCICCTRRVDLLK